jgi:hypothetical protein
MEIRVGWKEKVKKMFKVCKMTSPPIYLYNIGLSNINNRVTWHAMRASLWRTSSMELVFSKL